MRGPTIGCGNAILGRAVLVAGSIMLSGCQDITALVRKPELATCERFVRSAMKVPESFRRHQYIITDLPVTRAVLAQASGDAAAAASAPNPAIRRVFVQYYGDDGTRNEILGAGICEFALSDDGADRYVHDIDAAVDAAVHDNERRALSTSLGQPVGEAACCLAPGFDAAQLLRIKPIKRGKVSTKRRM